jgi:hypothetical protein
VAEGSSKRIRLVERLYINSMWRFSTDAVARAASALRSRPAQLNAITRAISFTPFEPVPSELDIEAALLGCELSVALARRPAPALEPYPELGALVENYLGTMGPFGGPQLAEPHLRARLLRDHPSALRDHAVREGWAAQFDADLEDLIARLNPSISKAPRPWWQQIDDITLTVVHGHAPAVEARLGVDRASARKLRFWDVWDGVPYDGVHLAVQIDELDSHAVIVEPTGWLLTSERLARQVSVGTSLVSVYWNTNALMQVTVARDGELVRRFDPLLYAHPAIGQPLREELDLPFGEPAACKSAAVTLLARLTGIEVDADWLLDRPHPTWHGLTVD